VSKIEKKIKLKPKLSNKNYKRAIDILFYVVDFMDKYNIIYHLEGGTLLGIVRDGTLLEWDYDVDISICENSLKKFIKYKNKLPSLKYKLTSKRFGNDYKAMKKGKNRIFKLKPRLYSMLKEFNEKFRNAYINIDIFIKYSDDKYTYWQAKDKALKVNNHFYKGYEEIEFMGKKLKVPVDYKNYLGSKYGDWQTPVKEWDCGVDEKTITHTFED